MKVVLVNTQLYPGGGAATYVFNLAELLRAHGQRVAFFAMQDARNVPDPNADLFVSQIDFRELNRHKSPANGLRAATRAIYSREARQKFRRLLQRVRPDLVHLAGIHAHLTPSIVLEAKAQGLPVLWGLHDYKLICPNTTFLIDRTGEICEACGAHAFYQPLLKRCKKDSLLASGLAALEAYVHDALGIRDKVDAFLSPSRFLRDKLLARGFDPARLHHLPNFLPESAFGAGEEASEPYILFMGRLEAIKGLGGLLAACQLAPEVRLVLAGLADEAARATWLADLPPNVAYVGQQEGEALRRLLDGARAVVVPSIWYENQPFSILEAFARHKPVIASDLGGMTELVANHERGLLVPPGNAAALAEALRWMLARPAEARAMGAAGYDYAAREHSAAQHYARLMLLYQGCLAGRPARQAATFQA